MLRREDEAVAADIAQKTRARIASEPTAVLFEIGPESDQVVVGPLGEKASEPAVLAADL